MQRLLNRPKLQTPLQILGIVFLCILALGLLIGIPIYIELHRTVEFAFIIELDPVTVDLGLINEGDPSNSVWFVGSQWLQFNPYEPMPAGGGYGMSCDTKC